MFIEGMIAIMFVLYGVIAIAIYHLFRFNNEIVWRSVIYAILFPISVPCAFVFGYNGYYG